MKVKFLKDHVDHKKGQQADLADGLANYLVAVGAAQYADGGPFIKGSKPKQAKPPKEKEPKVTKSKTPKTEK